MRSARLPIEALIEYYGLVQPGDHPIVEAEKEISKEQQEQLVTKNGRNTKNT